jgi:EmrB/QacA subfamily drug resistance transporter
MSDVGNGSGAAAVDGSQTSGIATGRNVPPWVVLLLVCLGQFMVVLDVSIVNVALPAMQRDLGFSYSGLQWVVNAYTLTFAGFLLLGGRAADLYGRRRMFILGLSLFTLASLAGGLAQTQAMLIGARALQGLGGAVLAPATLTILTTSFAEGAPRARALGVWSAVAAGGGAAGALLGGILTDLISWRWILFVNVPIGIVAILGARALLAETRGDVRHRSLDLAGAVTVTGGLVALVFAIVRTETYPWTSWQVVAPFLLAVLLLALFVLIEARIAKSPLMPLRILRSRSVAGANVFIMLLMGGMFASWYFQTLYMQNVLGYSPLEAGFAFLPQTIMIAVGAQISSRVVGRVGVRTLLIIGPLCTAAGLLWLTQISPTGTFLSEVLWPSILATFGMGLSFPASTYAATSGVPRQDAGLASGLINTNRQIGGSIGLAALATVAADRTTALLHTVPGAPSAAITAAAYTAGYARAFGVAGIIVAFAAVAAALILPARRRDAVPGASAEAEAEARHAALSLDGADGVGVELEGA